MTRTRIGLLLGDPAGVGPEIVAKLLARMYDRSDIRFTVIGTAEMLAAGAEVAGVELPPSLRRASAAPGPDGSAPVLVGIPMAEIGAIRFGEPSRAAGLYALRSLQLAVELVQAKRIDAIVYAPLNKHAMKLGGFDEIDEMHFLARLFGVKHFFTELNQLDDLWTTRVTSHVPIRDIAALLSPQRIIDATKLAAETMQRAGIARPRIAVAGLNPHAGDGGTIGEEDIEIIAPAVRALKAEGYVVEGPQSPDTVFLGARRGACDLVVTMYHDQGQIALKAMGFERVVTLLGGLPVPAITASSGTAYDITGRNAASAEALIRACDLARRLAESRAVPAPA
ncbi:MAG: PdxA family protein [Dongiales bacterium]